MVKFPGPETINAGDQPFPIKPPIRYRDIAEINSLSLTPAKGTVSLGRSGCRTRDRFTGVLVLHTGTQALALRIFRPVVACSRTCRFPYQNSFSPKTHMTARKHTPAAISTIANGGHCKPTPDRRRGDTGFRRNR